MTKSLLLNLTILFMNFSLWAQEPQIQSISSDENSVAKYGKFEAKVGLSATYSNPYDYNEIIVKGVFTGPNGEQFEVDGFYTQDFDLDRATGSLRPTGNQGTFKIRFSPNQIGSWTYQVSVQDQVGTANSSPETFNCITSKAKGFVRSNQTNYLHFDNGKQYIPVGENMAWQENNAFIDYKEWVTALSSNGGNFIRLWHAHWGLGIEWKRGWNNFSGLRRYEERNMAYQDWLFDFCADQGVYVMLALQHHGQVSSTVNPNWADSPYNVVNDGPCTNTWDFFTNEEAIGHTKNRLRYIVARWGYAHSIMAWELFNEVGWTDAYEIHQAAVADWHAEMAMFLKSIDPYQHLVTTSFSDESQDPIVWASPDIDITQTHYYLNTPHIEKALVRANQSYVESFGKPTLSGEFGLGSYPELSNMDPDGIHIHNGMWATLFGGGLGTSMSWWWDSYIHPRNLYYHFDPIARMEEEIPFLKEDLRPAKALVTGVPGDLSLVPSMGWAGIGEDTIVINGDGSLNPKDASLGAFLYGAQWNTQFRSPPTFRTNYPQAGSFTVRTNMESSNANPRIAIIVNGEKVLDEVASPSESYTVVIDAGPNDIKVDNTGTDWITIASYDFSGLGSQVDAYVLTSSDQGKAAGWILNNAYNHLDLLDEPQPEAILSAELVVEDFESGDYAVYWYDCLNGGVVETSKVSAAGGSLRVPIPDLFWDRAFWVERYSPGNQSTASAIDFRTYPNPAIAGSRVNINMTEKASSDLAEVFLYNAEGKPLYALHRNYPRQQEIEVELPADLPAGMYWLQLRQGEKMGSRPIVVAK